MQKHRPDDAPPFAIVQHMKDIQRSRLIKTLCKHTYVIVLILQWALHKNLWIVKQPTRVQVSFRLNNDRQAYEKITNELERYKISMYQFKWESPDGSLFATLIYKESKFPPIPERKYNSV